LGIIPRPAAPTATPTPVPIELRLAYWQTGVAGDRITSIFQKFVQQTAHVVVTPTVAAFGEHFANLSAAFAGGSPPDVFVESGAFFYDHVQAKGLRDLSGLVQADQIDLSQYWSEPIVRPIGGQLSAVPLWTADEVLYYNRDLLDQAGAAVPPDTWTWADLLGLAQKLTAGKPGQVSRWGLLLVNDLPGGWGSFVAGNAGHWLDPTTGQTDLGASASDALQWFSEAMLVHHVAPQPAEQQTLTQAGQIDPFLNGQVALFPTGTWEIPGALANAKFRWDVLPLPRAPGTNRSISLASSQPGCLARTSAHPDEAWQLLRAFLTADAQSQWANGKIRLPALKTTAADQTSGYAAPPPANAATAVKAMTGAADLGFVRNWNAWRAAVVNALEPAFDNKIPLADAVANAVKDGNAALKG
jgi:multiple sugar transport system substrate-binding protein